MNVDHLMVYSRLSTVEQKLLCTYWQSSWAGGRQKENGDGALVGAVGAKGDVFSDDTMYALFDDQNSISYFLLVAAS